MTLEGALAFLIILTVVYFFFIIIKLGFFFNSVY
jgi:hypothetical protein